LRRRFAHGVSLAASLQESILLALRDGFDVLSTLSSQRFRQAQSSCLFDPGAGAAQPRHMRDLAFCACLSLILARFVECAFHAPLTRKRASEWLKPLKQRDGK
jgi:hypothetical protein